jgi:hypothetical protein
MWWLPSPASVLSQGDIIVDVPIGTVTNPVKYLQKAALKGNSPGGWQESLKFKPDHNGMGNYLAHGRLARVIVLTYGCEVDKDKKKHRIVVAAVNAISNLSSEEQEIVMGQSAFHSMPLPGIPVLGDHYADLRLTTFLPKEILETGNRVASMTDEGVLRLQAQLIGFFTRLKVSEEQMSSGRLDIG